MPIYEYSCEKCKKDFEFIQSFSDDPKDTCEECGGKLVKQLSSNSFQLKGGGWYKEGYDSTRNKSAAKPESPKKTEKTAPAKKAPTSSK